MSNANASTSAYRRPSRGGSKDEYAHPIPDGQTPIVDRMPSVSNMASASYTGRRKERDYSPSPIRDSNWFDVPLVFALVPAIGSLLTGSDLLKDFLHLAFLLYYLHNLIKVPWTLYTAARARRPNSNIEASSEDQLRALARSELRMAELIYLVFTIVAPFLGAILLRSVSKVLSIDTVSTFSTSLFVLATGIRPWRHLVDLLRRRTEALHDVVHSPSADATSSRVEQLEAELAELRSLIKGRGNSQQSLIEEAASSLELARKEIKLAERQAELARQEADARIEALETSFHVLQNQHDRAPSYSPPYDDRALTITVPRHLFLQPLGFLGGLLGGGAATEKKGSGSPRRRLQGKGLVEEVYGEKTDDDTSDRGEVVRRRRAKEEQSGLIEWLIHTALFPLRLIRSCALVLLRQVG